MIMAAPIGPLATTSCEPRQARKGAAAAVTSGAGVWLVGAPPLPFMVSHWVLTEVFMLKFTRIGSLVFQVLTTPKY